jgi:hypothetical protein
MQCYQRHYEQGHMRHCIVDHFSIKKVAFSPMAKFRRMVIGSWETTHNRLGIIGVHLRTDDLPMKCIDKDPAEEDCQVWNGCISG